MWGLLLLENLGTDGKVGEQERRVGLLLRWRLKGPI